MNLRIFVKQNNLKSRITVSGNVGGNLGPLSAINGSITIQAMSEIREGLFDGSLKRQHIGVSKYSCQKLPVLTLSHFVTKYSLTFS